MAGSHQGSENRGRISSVGKALALDCRSAGGRRFDSRTRPILRVLKQLRNERISFALITARPSRGLDDHIKIPVPSPRGDVKQCPHLLASCLIHWHSDKLLRFHFTKTLWAQVGRRRNIYRGLVGSPPCVRETSTECKLDVTISSNCQLARKPRIKVQTSKKRFSLKPFQRKLVYCSNEQNLKNKTKQKQMNPRPVLGIFLWNLRWVIMHLGTRQCLANGSINYTRKLIRNVWLPNPPYKHCLSSLFEVPSKLNIIYC